MTFPFWYWLLMFAWLVLATWGYWPAAGQPRRAYLPLGANFIVFLLFLLLGWEAFGPPVK